MYTQSTNFYIEETFILRQQENLFDTFLNNKKLYIPHNFSEAPYLFQERKNITNFY
jgi:hypothetical protein